MTSFEFGLQESEHPPPRSGARTLIASTGLFLCVVVVLMATLWPTPLDQGYSESINRVLEVLHRNGVPAWFGYDKLEFSANIAMFVPLGFLLALLLPQRVWWLALIISPALSIGIELTQAQLLTQRFATVSDVIANSSGAVIGATFAVALRGAVHARDETVVARALWEQRHAPSGRR
jgi:glycopeptide antibiotics resistance protein